MSETQKAFISISPTSDFAHISLKKDMADVNVSVFSAKPKLEIGGRTAYNIGVKLGMLQLHPNL